MPNFLDAGLAHAAVASLLALAALAVCRAWRNPFVNRGVWLAVLLKFVVPPLVLLPLVRLPQVGSQELWRRAEPISPPPAEAPPRELPLEAASFTNVASEPQPPPAGPEIAAREATATTASTVLPAEDRRIVDPVDASGESRGRGADPAVTLPLAALAAATWFVGSATLLAIALRRIWRFHAALARSRVASHGWQRRTRRLAAAAGLRQPPLVRFTAGRTPPLAWRLGRQSSIVLPAGLVAGLTHAEAEAILAHEVMHLRRRDDRLRWLELVVVAAWWWCPLAWLARRRLHEAEERCCDADALRAFPATAAHYARALLATIDFVAPTPRLALAGAPFMDRGSLVRRFEMITSRQWPAPPTRRARTLLLAACGAVLLTTPIARSIETQPDKPDEARVAIPKDAEPPASAIADSNRSTLARPAPPEPNQQDAEPSDVEELHSSNRPVSVYLSNGDRIVGHWQTDGESLVFVPDDPLAGRLRLAAGFLPHSKTPTTTGSTPEPASSDKRESFRVWDLSLRECLDIAFSNAWFLEVSKQDDGSAIITQLKHLKGWAFKPLPDQVADTIVEVGDAYWELQFAYRELDARKIARGHALATWRQVKTLQRAGAVGGEDNREAQVRAILPTASRRRGGMYQAFRS